MTVRTADPSRTLPARTSVAVWALQASNWLSRVLGRGSGTVAGGRVGLAFDPGLLATLAKGRRVALVTGTNGKTTTTRMLVAALSGTGVVSNETGANMPAGHVAALAGTPPAVPAVLEVDEGYLGRLIEETAPRVVVLLNLSRDQLDRISEVRMLVDRWRTAFAGLAPEGAGAALGTTVVANADDPMVTWAAMAAPRGPVGGGRPGVAPRRRGLPVVWRPDRVRRLPAGGRASAAPFARPEREAWLEGRSGPGRRLALPGRARAARAVQPGQRRHGRPGRTGHGRPAPGLRRRRIPRWTTGPPTDPAAVLARVASVGRWPGRFSSTERHGHPVRLLLAKNPAGWTAIFDLLDEDRAGDGPVVLSVNARTADGFDTSWLWDVPFERLAGRSVLATGERRLDLAVRLRYAGVATTVVADPLLAVDHAVTGTGRDGGRLTRPRRFRGQLHGLRRPPGPPVTAAGAPVPSRHR